MGIEAVFIASQEGKLLYSRNYTSTLTQNLIEDFAFGLQSAFLKNNQHIFAAYGAHRLVYLPIENCILALVTDSASNIVEDVESIGRIKEVVAGLTDKKLTEETVYDHFVDLTMAFDEMISLNSRVLFTKSQIATLLQMESANEKIQQKMIDEKVQQTMKKNEAEIRQIERVKKVKEMMREEVNEIDRKVKEIAGDFESFGEEGSSKPAKSRTESKQTVAAPAIKKAIQLGKPAKGKQQAEKQKAEMRIEDAAKESIEEPEKPTKFNPLNDEVKLLLEERLSGVINSNGDLKRMDLKGALNLMIENEGLERFTIQTDHTEENKLISLKLPPIFDRVSWGVGQLALKPKSAPLAKKTVVETVKYSLSTPITQETAPFRLSFWFSGNQFSCEIEFNSSQTAFKSLANIDIKFKKLHSLDFEVGEVENSEGLTTNRYLIWRIPVLDRKTQMASLIVNFDDPVTESSVLPADIEIDSAQTVFGLNVNSVTEEGGREVKFSYKRLLGSKDLTVEV